MVALLAVLAVVALFVGFSLLRGVIIWLLWNEVVTAVVNDNGGNLHRISFWLAVGIGFVLGVISNLFKSGKSD